MDSSSNNNHIWSSPHSNVSTPFLDGSMVPPLSPYQGSDGYFTTANTFQPPPPSYWSSLVAEDGLSICSSLSSTPEIIDHQSFVDELFTTSTSNRTDPALFNTNNMPITNQQVIYQQQQLMTPLLETPSLTYHVQKNISYHYQPITHPIQNAMVSGVNYTLDPYTHSTSYQQNNTPFTYNVYDTATYNTSTVHMRTDNYQHQQQQQHHHHDYTTPIQQETAINHLIATKENSDFPCLEPDCNKVFSRPYNLKSHMRTHTQERPFECDYKKCGWKFARIHDLKRHILKHTGVQPHGCEFCYKRFARSDALKRHWKVDTQCSKSLSEYKLQHDGKEPTSNNKKRKRASPK